MLGFDWMMKVVFFTGLLSFASSSFLVREERAAESYSCSGEPKEIPLSQGQEMVLETPGYKGNFLEDCQETWTINLNRGIQELSQWRIRIEVLDMDMPCNSASLSIFEDDEAPPNIEYCNQKNRKQIFYSHFHSLDIIFKTNNCQSGEVCKGNGAKFKVSAEYVCGGTYTEDNGVITSPFYPNNYPASTTCIYNIMAPKDKQVLVQCEDFNLKGLCNGRCNSHTGDKDMFQDLTGGLARYEGDELKDKKLKSKSHHSTFYLRTNNRNIRNNEGPYGFSCSYNFV